MKTMKLLILGILVAGIWVVVDHTGATAQAVSPTVAQTGLIVAATDAFLNSLNATQREKVQFPFTPQKTAKAATFAKSGDGRQGGADGGRQRGGGQSMGPRGGFAGFVGEQYGQAVWSNFPVSDVPRLGLALGSLNISRRDAAMHLLQVVLIPKGYRKVLEIMGSDQALSDGGHHLALNITVAGELGTITPTLTGAQPATYTSNGRTVRALAQENDKA